MIAGLLLKDKAEHRVRLLQANQFEQVTKEGGTAEEGGEEEDVVRERPPVTAGTAEELEAGREDDDEWSAKQNRQTRQEGKKKGFEMKPEQCLQTRKTV